MWRKRLKALLPIIVPALARHGHLCLDAGVHERRSLLIAVGARHRCRQP